MSRLLSLRQQQELVSNNQLLEAEMEYAIDHQ
jgi:hypothetical protein